MRRSNHGFVIGVKLGQRHQPSGLCVAQVEDRSATHFVIRYLSTVPSGTSIPDISARVAEVARGCRNQGVEGGDLFVDVTGLGEPIVEHLQEVVPNFDVTAVYFTHGDRKSCESGLLQVGKCYLVTRLQLLLQTGRLHLPSTDEARVLAQDLQEFEIHVDPNANDRYGAYPVGSRDELVTALGLAVLQEPTGPAIWCLKEHHLSRPW